MIPVVRGVLDPTSSTDQAAPLLVLGPSLGTVSDAWAPAASRLTATHRVVRFDLPGHGISPATREPFTMADLAAAVLVLVDSLGGGRFRYAGASLGGAIGIELAAGPAGDRLDGLAVICSNAKIGEAEGWTSRAEQVRRQGTASLIAATSGRWFAPGYLTREPDVVGRMLKDLVDVDDESYALCCEALAGFDRRADAGSITARSIVIAGDSDPVVTADQAAELAAAMGARSELLADTGHQAQVERADTVAALLTAAFPANRYDAGMIVRREVLSGPYVDASLAGITPDTRDFQRFITEYAWGSVWTRPGLDRRMRSAVTISSLVTAHHWHELELHLHAAQRNGLTKEEITEILLQTAIYAGVPDANTAFGIAKRVFAETAAAAQNDDASAHAADDEED
ncbi:alpha/beta fold hydrolase [Naasia aerilata]|uniref:3-oxoadipate enol-lactonase n=1 Tax=Naasia aerilata TaxID=1162966 RepID=A0ABN6XL81_9MICO|nr:alpha/beta fold hydrolase [Naasia aerilata]BDZ44430.1 3-oxoadipate enol-lactonase [Naasia aerilata]